MLSQLPAAFVPAPLVAPALAANNIVPFVAPAIGGAALAVASAPVAPIAAAVVLGLSGGLLVGAIAAQIWGRRAGAKRTTVTTGLQSSDLIVTVPTPSIVSGKWGYAVFITVATCTGELVSEKVYEVAPNMFSHNARKFYRVRQRTKVVYQQGRCSPTPQQGPSVVIDVVLEYSNTGVTWDLYNAQSGNTSRTIAKGTFVDSYIMGNWAQFLVNGAPVSLPPSVIERPDIYDETYVFPEPALLLQPVPAEARSPLVVTAGERLSAAPQAEPSSNPAPLPQVFLPRPVNAFLPQLPPATEPSTAIAPTPATQRRYGQVVVTAPPIPATLPAIAEEVSRIEQKLAFLLDNIPAAQGDFSDKLQLLFNLLNNAIGSLTDGVEPTTWYLSSPCVLDEDGQRLESSVGVDGGDDLASGIMARFDAMAALLQTHKDLKQPICSTKAAGQPVTVNFLQME